MNSVDIQRFNALEATLFISRIWEEMNNVVDDEPPYEIYCLCLETRDKRLSAQVKLVFFDVVYIGCSMEIFMPELTIGSWSDVSDLVPEAYQDYCVFLFKESFRNGRQFIVANRASIEFPEKSNKKFAKEESRAKRQARRDGF